MPPTASSPAYYPAFLNLAGRHCVIVGGGKVAERKCLPLVRAGARVSVISPAITRVLERYREKGLLRHVRRAYRRGDIRSAIAVIAATDSEKTNRRVAADAAEHNILVNVVDNPPLCSFIAPSVVTRGPLTIAISTSGVSPALARAIRREIEGMFGQGFSGYLRFLKGLRRIALKEISDKAERARFLKGFASPEMIELVRREGFHGAKEAAMKRWQASRRSA